MLTDEQRKLAEDNIRLAYWCAHQMKWVQLELEERISMALLGLTKAAEKYSPATGTEFSTFAMTVMQNEILSNLRREKKHFGVISLNLPIGEDNHRGGALEELVPDKNDHIGEAESVIDAERLLEKSQNMFSGKEKQLLEELIQNPGMNQKYYGNRLGISQSHVSRLLRNMRDDVRRKLICREE